MSTTTVTHWVVRAYAVPKGTDPMTWWSTIDEDADMLAESGPLGDIETAFRWADAQNEREVDATIPWLHRVFEVTTTTTVRGCPRPE